MAALHEALEADPGNAELVELIRSLIDEITLTPEGGSLRADLKGELAGILKLASESKKPSPVSREGLEQMKLVAGACNHLYRTVLVWFRHPIFG